MILAYPPRDVMSTAYGSRTPGLVKEQLRKLPQWIKVGGESIRLRVYHEEDSGREEAWGHFNSARAEIAFNDGCPSMAHLGTVVIHELIHAIWHAYRIDGQADQEEETYVDLISVGFWQIARDNPWFLDWWKDCLRFEHNGPPPPPANADHLDAGVPVVDDGEESWVDDGDE